ncbi:MAG: hypothetical protein ACR2MK_11150 [Solirubrobacteraceae bacterium]
MSYVLVLVILAVAVFVISAPLRAARDPRGSDSRLGKLAELEAAREAKYREIRDAELDLRTGKLSHEDYEAVDRGLRGEAIEIMHALDAVQGD